MKKLLTAIFGAENAEKPASKTIAYAAIATVAALVLAAIILVISLIAGAFAKEEEALPADGEGGEGGSSIKIEYTTVTIEDLANIVGGMESVDLQTARTKNGTDDTDKYYYAAPSDTLKKIVQAELDAMLVKFYETKNVHVFVGGTKMVSDKSGFVVELRKDASSFANAEVISNTGDYTWIYDNAAKYGFVYEGNTFTYVGKAAAAKGIEAVKSSTADAPVGTASAKCYFVKADANNIKLPTNYEYTVTAYGNGYIVTVDLTKKVTK